MCALAGWLLVPGTPMVLGRATARETRAHPWQQEISQSVPSPTSRGVVNLADVPGACDDPQVLGRREGRRVTVVQGVPASPLPATALR